MSQRTQHGVAGNGLALRLSIAEIGHELTVETGASGFQKGFPGGIHGFGGSRKEGERWGEWDLGYYIASFVPQCPCRLAAPDCLRIARPRSWSNFPDVMRFFLRLFQLACLLAILAGGLSLFTLPIALYPQISPPVVRIETTYTGASAGSNLAGPTIRTTNDMPIVEPMSLRALDLVDFQINPHYVDPEEDRKQREEIEARNEADNAVYRSEKMLKENKDKISGSDKDKIEKAISEVKDALKGNDAAAIKSASDTLVYFCVVERLEWPRSS